jgi:hypothetical protein
MLKITIFMSREGRDKRDMFSNVFTYNGAPAFNSEAAETTVVNLAEALKRAFPNTVNFMKGRINRIDSNLRVIKGYQRSVPLSGAGVFAIPGGDRLAPRGTVVAFKKYASFGTEALQVFQNAITSEELDQWTKTGAKPARFTDRKVPGDMTSLTFLGELLAAGSAQGLTMVLPAAGGDFGNAPRTVMGMALDSITHHKPKRVKASVLQKAVSGHSAYISDLAQRARRVLQPNKEGIVTFDARLMAYKLNVAAEARFDGLSIEEASRVTWPEVFKHDPVPPLPALI